MVRKVVACVGDDFGSISQSTFLDSQGKQVADLSAYEAVLAIHYFVERLDKQTCQRARQPLEHAVEMEPSYARALAAAYEFNMPTLFWDPLVRGATLGTLGRKQEGVKAVQELHRLQPDFATRPDFYVGCFVHADQTREDVLDGLRVGGLS